jgi:hypothetical protein
MLGAKEMAEFREKGCFGNKIAFQCIGKYRSVFFPLIYHYSTYKYFVGGGGGTEKICVSVHSVLSVYVDIVCQSKSFTATATFICKKA